MASIYQLYGQLHDVQQELEEVLKRKQEITRKIADMEERLTMRKRADYVSSVIKRVSDIKDPTLSLHQANTFLLPQRHNLPPVYFENTLEAIPEGFPSNWTRAKAAEFFTALSNALERDIAALDDASFVFY